MREKIRARHTKTAGKTTWGAGTHVRRHQGFTVAIS